MFDLNKAFLFVSTRLGLGCWLKVLLVRIIYLLGYYFPGMVPLSRLVLCARRAHASRFSRLFILFWC